MFLFSSSIQTCYCSCVKAVFESICPYTDCSVPSANSSNRVCNKVFYNVLGFFRIVGAVSVEKAIMNSASLLCMQTASHRDVHSCASWILNCSWLSPKLSVKTTPSPPSWWPHPQVWHHCTSSMLQVIIRLGSSLSLTEIWGDVSGSAGSVMERILLQPQNAKQGGGNQTHVASFIVKCREGTSCSAHARYRSSISILISLMIWLKYRIKNE